MGTLSTIPRVLALTRKKGGGRDHVCGEGDDGNPSCEHAQRGGGRHTPETWDDRFCRICGRPVEWNQKTSRYRHGENH